MPPAVWAWPTSRNSSRILRSEFEAPISDGFIGDVQAAFRQEIFRITQAQGETEKQPDCVLDDFGWKSMPFAGDSCHPANLAPLEDPIQGVNLSMPAIRFLSSPLKLCHYFGGSGVGYGEEALFGRGYSQATA